MKTYLILAVSTFIFSGPALAQKDSTRRQNTTTATKPVAKKITLTVEQEQWLRNNYQHIAGIKKDSAKKEVRKNFSDISEASMEYLIAQAGKLMQDDKKKHLAQVQQMLNSLNAQKKELAKKIVEKEKELHTTKDKDKAKAITDEISGMKNKMKELDKEIKYLHETK